VWAARNPSHPARRLRLSSLLCRVSVERHAAKVGTLEAGKWADLEAVRGDPLKDITELPRVKFLMKAALKGLQKEEVVARCCLVRWGSKYSRRYPVRF